MAIAAVREQKIKYFFCLCGKELHLSLLTGDYVTCPRCEQKWKLSEKGGEFETVQHKCGHCDNGILFGPTTGKSYEYGASPTVERCDECMLFADDNAALEAVRSAWLKEKSPVT